MTKVYYGIKGGNRCRTSCPKYGEERSVGSVACETKCNFFKSKGHDENGPYVDCGWEDVQNTLDKKPSGYRAAEKVLGKTVDLWNEYIKLPDLHPSEGAEVASAIHVIQGWIAMRMLSPFVFGVGTKGECEHNKKED